MKKNKYVIILFVVLLSSCASTDDINRLQNKIDDLDRKNEKQINGVLLNQKTMNEDLIKLHKESEDEFSRNRNITNNLKKDVDSAKSKTDVFRVNVRENNALILEVEEKYRNGEITKIVFPLKEINIKPFKIF